MRHILSAIVLALFVITIPLSIDSIVYNLIKKTKTQLKNEEISFEVSDSKGYFDSYRTFEVKIKDITLLNKLQKDELKDIISKVIENYKDKEEIVLIGEIKNSNLNPFPNIEIKVFLAPDIYLLETTLNSEGEIKSININRNF